MNAQLLLLLALAGPFCAFTRASPTIIPTGTDSLVISGPPPTAPKVVPLEMTTALDTVEPFLEITTASATVKTPLDITPAAASSEVFLGGTMEATTEAAPNNSSPAPNNTLLAQNINITSTLVSKSTYMPKSHQPLSTHAAAAETAAPTKEAEVAQTTGTAAATTECSGDLLNQEKPVDGLTPSQAAGIVIGALLAVAAVIAVAIVVARRMGKYTP